MNEESRNILKKLRDLKPQIMERHRIKRMRVFGSVGRGDAGPESDVDLIVEFEKIPSLLKYVGVQHAIEDMLGRKVDLLMEDEIHKALKERILSEATDV